MVNYPNGKAMKSINEIDYAHRGMSLEDDINDTNKYYLNFDLAAIYKKPTPIQITKVDYQSRNKARITEAFFQIPSTTDYNGIYQGKYLDFEAKETHSKTSFVISLIHPHQLKHMERVIRYGGIAFVIIRFVAYNETYFVLSQSILNYINTNQRKSIPYAWFKENGTNIPYNYAIKVDYLKVIKQILTKENN